MQPLVVEAGITLASRYRLEHHLEQVPASDSAGAQTWHAHDSVLSRPVIIHLLPADDPRAELLLEAARRASTATDVRFLRVLDAVSEDGVAYVVKEWVAGRTLTQLLTEDGPLPARPAGWIIREVAEAVTSVHGQGGAHLRLDPGNIILTDSGTVRVDGLVIDAVLYGVPRTITEADVARVDAHGLGQLLYAALTSRWPVGADVAEEDGLSGGLPSARRTADGVLLSPRQCRAGVPRLLDEITDRILADHPRHGTPLQTPLEVTAALTEAVGNGPPDGILTLGSARSGASRPNGSTLTPTPGATLRRSNPAEVTAPVRRYSDPSGTVAGPAPTWAPPATASGGVGWPSRPDAPSRKRLPLVLGIIAVCLGAIGFLGWQLAFNGLSFDGFGLTETQRSPTPATPRSAEPAPSEPIPTGPTPGQVYPIAAAKDFDPDPGADGEEHPDEVPATYDGDPDTSWSTQEYYNWPDFGRLKDGVGIWFDLGDSREVGQVTVALVGDGTDLELRAPGEAAEPPSTLAGWEMLDQIEGAGTEATFEFDEPVSTRYLLLWLTKLPLYDPDRPGFRGEVAEVVVSR